MKLSIEQANKLLSALPAGVVVVADELEADTDIDTDALLASMQKEMSDSLRPTLEESLKPTLESAFTGRYLGALRSAAQRVFSVPKRELENMSIEQVLAHCKGALDVLSNQTDEQRQTKLELAIQDYEAQLEQLKADYEQQLGTERARYTERDITARCAAIIGALPRKGGDVQEQADMLRYKMQAAYEVQYNEQRKQLEFYKDGKQVVNEQNQPLTDEDFARTWATKAGILVNDTRHVKPADVLAGQQGAYGTGIVTLAEDSPEGNGMDAIAAWAETPNR
jgi:hypothetical protein